MTEQFSNFAQTTLSTAITSTIGNTITVTSYTNFPSSANFRIVVDGEIMIVTGGAGTVNWTVTRGAEGTTATYHNVGAIVTHILTAGGLQQFKNDTLPSSGAFASIPTAGNPGRLYRCTDAPYVAIDNGSSWNYFGPIYPMTPINDTGFTWVNQGSATYTGANGIGYLSDPGGQGSSVNMHLRVKPVPATPYTAIMAFTINASPGAGPLGGMCLYNSSSGSLIALAKEDSNAGVASYWIRQCSNTGVYSNNPFQQQCSATNNPFWVKITDDGTNRTWNWSFDGYNYQQIYTDSHTNYITATHIGYMLDNYAAGSGHSSGITVYSWSGA